MPENKMTRDLSKKHAHNWQKGKMSQMTGCTSDVIQKYVTGFSPMENTSRDEKMKNIFTLSD